MVGSAGAIRQQRMDGVTRFLTDREMLSLMLRALAERTQAVAVEDMYQITSDGRIRISPPFYERKQVGIDLDVGVERQREGFDFYMTCAVPAMTALADRIGTGPIVCARFKDDKGCVTAEQGNYAMRLWVANDVNPEKQIGRFDVLYRPAS